MRRGLHFGLQFRHLNRHFGGIVQSRGRHRHRLHIAVRTHVGHDGMHDRRVDFAQPVDRKIGRAHV